MGAKLLQNMGLRKNEEEKDVKHVRKLIREDTKITGAY